MSFKYHTVRKSQIVSKNSIFRKNSKIVKLNFRAKNDLSIVIYGTLISIRIWIFTPKIVKIQQFSSIVDTVITIFGAKIQIIQANLVFKNSQNWSFPAQKFEFTILNFWTQFEIFQQCEYVDLSFLADLQQKKTL